MPSRRGDAVRALGLLTGGVGADRRTLDDGSRVDGDVTVAGQRPREAVHAPRRRPALLLADSVVLRAVAGALEPAARRARRHAAPEVRTLLVQRDEPELHPGDDALVVDRARVGHGVG